jgi:membrane-associated phospholipid phosphatase
MTRSMRPASKPLTLIGRHLPRGWADFGLQLGIWLGFGLFYQVARGVADRGADEAFANGRLVIDAQQSSLGLFDLDVNSLVADTGGALVQAANWTYWNSQFTVVGLVLLWVYFRRTESFLRLRNTLLVANVLGLVGFMAMPTAPPRFFPELGFVDTLAADASLNHGSGLVQLASNQFAAMPSLHSADSLIVGVAMALLVGAPLAKLAWLCWPAWVWFSVMATGNHFWLDIAAGIALAGIATSIVAIVERRRSPTRRPTIDHVATS